MKIEIRFKSLSPSDELREHAVRRLRFDLRRFGAEVNGAMVRITDVNGPRGGVDKRCRVTVSGRRIGSPTVEEHHEDAFAAVGLAVGRAARAVARELERGRARLRSPTSPPRAA